MTPTVLVTGGSRGIGAAAAVLAAQRGWDVAINYTRDAAAAERVAEQVRAAGRRALVIQADVAEEPEVLAMFAAVAPLFLAAGVVFSLLTVPGTAESEAASGSPLAEIRAGIRQFLTNRPVWTAVALYVLVYSGGNAILANVSLHARDQLGDQANTLGMQSFLRFKEGDLFLAEQIRNSQFALEDQKEGMAAFIDKRKPAFRNR